MQTVLSELNGKVTNVQSVPVFVLSYRTDSVLFCVILTDTWPPDPDASYRSDTVCGTLNFKEKFCEIVLPDAILNAELLTVLLDVSVFETVVTVPVVFQNVRPFLPAEFFSRFR